MKNLNNLLKLLLENHIDFVLVGGFASTLYGSTMVTRDIDICYAMTPENIENLREILKDFHPVHRQTMDKLSFIELPKELKGINNLYLDTDLGTLDVLSQITGVGDYEKVKAKCIEVSVFGHQCKVISLDDLITAKKALGRNKDLLVVQELEEIRKKKS